MVEKSEIRRLRRENKILKRKLRQKRIETTIKFLVLVVSILQLIIGWINPPIVSIPFIRKYEKKF